MSDIDDGHFVVLCSCHLNSGLLHITTRI